MSYTDIPLLMAHKKSLLVGALDRFCQILELTDTQYSTAKDRYEAVGEWLADSQIEHLKKAQIYPHGSLALGTTTKPLKHNEFDGDLVCLLPTISHLASSVSVKTLIGDRLKEHGKYRDMLEEKRRCWRINFANEFHLDVTPAILNPFCWQAGELVPDKDLRSWKPTNPKGYIQRFEHYSQQQPKFAHIFTAAEDKKDIQKFPKQTFSKPILKRIVQLVKRHRDHAFATCMELSPISIVLTTLAAWSYSHCVLNYTYADTFDLIVDVIRRLPMFIRIEEHYGQKYYRVENETTTNENFAEKWNQQPELAEAFFNWHRILLASLESLPAVEGIDQFGKHLQKIFGATLEQTNKIFIPFTSTVSTSRTTRELFVAPTIGITTTPTVNALNVHSNTFYGR